MSLADPACYPQPDGRLVCIDCFEDEDIQNFIGNEDQQGVCSFCGNKGLVSDIGDVVEHMKMCLTQFYGLAVNQLPYISSEGGYQGPHWDTYDLLVEHVQLELPNDDGVLFQALVDHLGDEIWCEYDWLDFDFDEGLLIAWKQLCEILKHQRRFFFIKNTPEDDKIITSDGILSPEGFLKSLTNLIDELSLIREIPKGEIFFRAREIKPGTSPHSTAADLGPPPKEISFQANRMNPPGIPMTYGAIEKETAIKEISAAKFNLAIFQYTRPVKILDLISLPEVPGMFSGKSRREILGIAFLKKFSKEISKPINKDDQSFHIEYIPSQVVTEFLRDYDFEGGQVDGICFESSTSKNGRNLVLFASQDNILDVSGNPITKAVSSQRWIQLVEIQ